ERVCHDQQERVDGDHQQVRKEDVPLHTKKDGRRPQDDKVTEEDQTCADEELSAILDVAYAEDAQRRSKQRGEGELEIIIEELASNERECECTEEPDPRVENNGKQNRRDGHRHDVHGQALNPNRYRIQRHHPCKQDGQYHDLPVILKYRAAQQIQIQEKHEIGSERDEELAKQHTPEEVVLATIDSGPFQRGELTFDVLRHPLSFLNDEGAFFYVAPRKRNPPLFLHPLLDGLPAIVDQRGNEDRTEEGRAEAGYPRVFIHGCKLPIHVHLSLVESVDVLLVDAPVGGAQRVPDVDFLREHAVDGHIEHARYQELGAELPGLRQKLLIETRSLGGLAGCARKLRNALRIRVDEELPLVSGCLQPRRSAKLHVQHRVARRLVRAAPAEIQAVAPVGHEIALWLRGERVAVCVDTLLGIGHRVEVVRHATADFGSLFGELLLGLVDGEAERCSQILPPPLVSDLDRVLINL